MMIFKALSVMSVTFMIAHFATAQSMVVKSNNGYSSAIDLSSINSIVFNNNNLVVNQTECGASYFNVYYSEKISFGTSTAVEENQSLAPSIVVYPNPVFHSLTIDKGTDNHSNVSIFNAIGHAVLSFTTDSRQSTIDVSNLPGGLYFILTDKQSAKFIKQ